jgi:hypothetical protein
LLEFGRQLFEFEHFGVVHRGNSAGTSPSQSIIGVSPVFSIPANGGDRTPEVQTLPARLFADFQPLFRAQAGRL